MVKKYIPMQGDIVSSSLDKNNVSAIVISNNVFNKYTGMVILCPIMDKEDDFPTHYILNDSKKVHGTVLCEQIRSVDYVKRNIKFIEKASDVDIISVLALTHACLDN